ncbi:hypothetical protein [Telluribacter humicola]|uniref:hypothetical protein n=1 Tax=Telluribacter humicola TaxID=1720261 RepID=UPI001A979D55|nr:hypothetical protein [Telluribacter humicola]
MKKKLQIYYRIGLWNFSKSAYEPISSLEQLGSGIIYCDSFEMLSHHEATKLLRKFKRKFPSFRFSLIDEMGYEA